MLKKILPILAIVSITSSILVPFEGAFALSSYSGGLLDGKTLTKDGTTEKTTFLTDNDVNTEVKIVTDGFGRFGYFYNFSEPMAINKYVVNYHSGGVILRFYDSEGRVLFETLNPPNDVITMITPVQNVSKVYIRDRINGTGVTIKEFNVYGGTDVIPPSVPTGLTVTVGDGSAFLDWADNTETDLRGYNVYQSTDNVTFIKITSSPLTTSNYNVTGLTNGTKYYFAVTALDNAWNESSRSSSVSVTPVADTTAPGEVTNIQTSVTDTTIDLTFTKPTDADFTGTKLYLNGVLKATLDKTKTSYSFANLAPNTPYTIKVTTFDTSGNESAGVTTTVKTKVPLVEDVTDLQADAKYDRIKLSWTRPDSEFFSHVKIYRKKIEQQSFWNQLFGATSVSAATTSDGYTPMFETNGTYWTDLTVTPDTTYSYKVTSVNTEGNESQGVTIETTTPSEPVPKIEGVSTTQNKNGDYVVTWTSPSEGIVKVVIGGKEYTVVDAATQQVMIPKEDMKTDFFGGYDAKLVPIGKFGTEGHAVQVPTVQGKKIEFPILFDDFMKTVINILTWAAPLILLSLVFIFWRPFIAFLRKTIFAKGGRIKS
ncbi:fibronectin type III domain-containing protein [Geobacillus thermoleovorans]|uniref:fibronectin type III domain-containing protein n=1 Tax=Geobacillus thermoleovorans TaxID=33941 RepID=UPI00345C108F